MSQSNYKPRLHSEIATPPLGYYALFFSSELSSWAQMNDAGIVTLLQVSYIPTEQDLTDANDGDIAIGAVDIYYVDTTVNINVTMIDAADYRKPIKIINIGSSEATFNGFNISQKFNGEDSFQIRNSSAFTLHARGGQWFVT